MRPINWFCENTNVIWNCTQPFIAKICLLNSFTLKGLPINIIKFVSTFCLVFLFSKSSLSQVSLGIQNQINWSFSGQNTHWVNTSISLRSNIQVFKNISLDLLLGYAPEIYDDLPWKDEYNNQLFDKYVAQLIQGDAQISYTIFKSKIGISVYCLLGSLFAINVYQKTINTFPPTKLSINRKISLNNIYLNVGLGAAYRYKKFSIFFEPVYYYALLYNGIFKNRLGINFGILYCFGNGPLLQKK